MRGCERFDESRAARGLALQTRRSATQGRNLLWPGARAFLLYHAKLEDLHVPASSDEHPRLETEQHKVYQLPDEWRGDRWQPKFRLGRRRTGEDVQKHGIQRHGYVVLGNQRERSGLLQRRSQRPKRGLFKEACHWRDCRVVWRTRPVS